jgi:hypothetical protein
MIDSTATRMMTAGLLALALCLYVVALSGHLSPGAMPVETLNLTFNSMAEHLLSGRFDVDPAIVGKEGFAVNGAVVAYWGILPALLRLPLVLIPGGERWDVTAVSCGIAVCFAAAVKIQTLRLVFRHFESGATIGHATFRLLYWSMVLTILFSGPQIEFLKPSIYQEVCLWAGALAAMFIYWAVRGLIQQRFSTSSLCAMAVMAGLALLTRASTGVGLYAACGLLLAACAATRPRLAGLQLAPPLSILILFMGIAGFVNHMRWGDPMVFADYHHYLADIDHPDRLQRLVTYGLFNPTRIPIGLSYYFAPIIFLHTSGAPLVFEAAQARLLDFAELPPSSFFLTDPLLLGLMLGGCGTMFSRADRSAGSAVRAVSIGVGLSAPALLMLCAISMSHRYRIDFYPFIEFGAFLGLVGLLIREAPVRRLTDFAIVGAAAISVAGSFLVLGLYRLSELGSAISLLRPGVFGYYAYRLEMVLSRLTL